MVKSCMLKITLIPSVCGSRLSLAHTVCLYHGQLTTEVNPNYPVCRHTL